MGGFFSAMGQRCCGNSSGFYDDQYSARTPGPRYEMYQYQPPADPSHPYVYESVTDYSGKEQEQSCCSRCRRRCCGCCCLFLVLFLIFAAVIAVFYFNAAWSNSLQTYTLSLPPSTLKSFMWPASAVLGLIESIGIGRVHIFAGIQDELGPNFTLASQVWFNEFDQVRHTLENPQKRSWFLGTHPLMPRNLPAVATSRNVFLLSLSDAPIGDGSHQAFRQCFIDTLLQEWETRMGDQTAEQLFDRLVSDYQELTKAEFFTNAPAARGVQKFTVRFLHYLLLGIDPDDQATFDRINPFFTGEAPLAYYLYPMGYFTSSSNVDETASVYEASPAFNDFTAQSKYMDMTAKELALLTASIMRIAGVQGFTLATQVVLGWFELAGAYPGALPINTLPIWDNLDLNNDTELKLFTYECLRLSAPVTITSRVATEDFEVVQEDGNFTFPNGTIIANNLQMAMVDPSYWGNTSYQFDLNRPGLVDSFMGFNSFWQHKTRECPARELVINTFVQILKRLGQTRRSQSEDNEITT